MLAKLEILVLLRVSCNVVPAPLPQLSVAKDRKSEAFLLLNSYSLSIDVAIGHKMNEMHTVEFRGKKAVYFLTPIYIISWQ